MICSGFKSRRATKIEVEPRMNRSIQTDLFWIHVCLMIFGRMFSLNELSFHCLGVFFLLLLFYAVRWFAGDSYLGFIVTPLQPMQRFSIHLDTILQNLTFTLYHIMNNTYNTTYNTLGQRVSLRMHSRKWHIWLMIFQHHPPRKILQAFKTWDKDGNGFITKDELADVQLGGRKNAGKRAGKRALFWGGKAGSKWYPLVMSK